MEIAALPDNEDARLEKLLGFGLLDTETDPTYEAFVKLVSEMCDVPVAYISLIDAKRQWFKASVGLPGVCETSRDIAFCAHAILGSDILEISDASVDPRFADNPLVTGEPFIRFYAGMPLIDHDGFALGTLCAVDRKPRSLTEKQRAALRSISKTIVRVIESRGGVPAQQLEQIRLVSRAIDFATDPMAIVDPRSDGGDAMIIFVNRALTEMFGYSAMEVLGKSPSMFHGPLTDRDKIARIRSISASGGTGTGETMLYTKSGSARRIEIGDRSMDNTFRVVTLKDRTHEHAAQQALLLTNRRLHSLFANNIDAILTIDTNGTCMDANNGALELFGKRRDQLLGFGFIDVAPEGLFPSGELFPEGLRAGEPFEFTTAYARHDGSLMRVDGKAIPIVVEAGTEGAYVIVRDVTERLRSAETVVRQSKRTRALCVIAGEKGSTPERQIEAALATARDALDMQFAYVGEAIDSNLVLRHVCGPASTAAVGDMFSLEDTHVGRMLASGDTLAVNDLAAATVADAPQHSPWGGYVCAPISIGDDRFGAIGFLSRRPIAFTDFDVDFVRLVASLVSASLERGRQNDRLDRLAYFDGLTALPNRVNLLQEIEAEISRSRRHARSFALHFIDLDGFKSVNDLAGHAVGDLVLREAASRLRRTLRAEDTPARLGGDEFVVLQTDVTQPSEVDAFGRRLVAEFCAPFVCGGRTFEIGASVGIAVYPADGADANTLLEKADAALYRAKSQGKRRAERCAIAS